MNTEIDRDGEIAELKADIKAIKDANPNWAGDANIRADIRAKDNRILALEQRGKPSFPISHPVSHDNYLVYMLF